MRFFYSFLMYLLTPYLLLRLFWKGRSLPLYKERVLERFCLDKSLKHQPVDVWVHAVSLGEVIAATPLIEALLAKKYSLLVTTMTPTGSKHLKTRFGEKIIHQYIPYDLLLPLKRFFNRFKPRVGIIMETELWPNLIHAAYKAKVPLFLANARLSERSLKKYLRFAFFFQPILNRFTAILSQSEEDGERFMGLGARKEIVQNLGNMKFDLEIKTLDTQEFLQLKSLWGKKRPVLIAASTHDNEELQILSELNSLQKAIPEIILLIAPRHPERFQAVFGLSKSKGFKTGLRSLPTSIANDTEVVILDSLGELLGFYGVSDFAFVGGSFVPVGGHNVLEPIAMNVPVLSGHHVHNFKTICNELSQKEAIVIVHGVLELVESVITLQRDKVLANSMKNRAAQVLENNKGSVQRHLQRIEAVLD